MYLTLHKIAPWWRHQMQTSSASLAICAGNSPVTGEFPAQMPVSRNFDVFFDLRLHKWLSKHWLGWWFETPSRPLWRHLNAVGWPCTPMKTPQVHMFLLLSLHSLNNRSPGSFKCRTVSDTDISEREKNNLWLIERNNTAPVCSIMKIQ